MPDSVGGFSVPPLVRFSKLVMAGLGEAREELDALNVYPVPDGDTGTNLFLTFEAAHEALMVSVAEQGGEDAAEIAVAGSAYARGLLLGARGNSGVIMSQLVGALLRRIGRAAPGERPAAVFARGMLAASRAAYAAVGRPVEGTMLTVARAASEAALRRVADPEVHTGEALQAAVVAAREALARTPQQLDVLRQAGVVDAGGSGFCVVLEAAESALTGRRTPDRTEGRRRRAVPAPLPVPFSELPAGGAAYEVMYLLEADDDAVPPLRDRLSAIGESLVVVGGDGLYNVHVHADDIGGAIEAGIAAGRPHRIRVTDLGARSPHDRQRHPGRSGHQAGPRAGLHDPPDAGAPVVAPAGAPSGARSRSVVVVSAGRGLSRLFAESGATVLETSAGRRPSTAELLAAVRSTGAREVVVLPNARDILPAAEAAASLAESEDGIKVAVVPTRAQVQAMAALAVHEPTRSFENDLVEMAAAARHARSGAVTVAARGGITSAGPCEPGDVLGVVEGDPVVVGTDPATVAVQVLELMLGGGGELVTIVAGDGGAELAAHCAEHLRRSRSAVDVLEYDGGQERYPVLLGVE